MEKNDAFDILKSVSNCVTLIQLMDSLVNANNAISIVVCWVFESNYKEALCLTQESLGIICSPSVGEEKVASFRSVLYTVRYIWATIYLLKGQT